MKKKKTLEEVRKENLKMGKRSFIKKLVSSYRDSIKGMSVLDIIEDHMELYPQYRSRKLLKKIINAKSKKEAQNIYINNYRKSLEKEKFKDLVESYT